MKVYLVGESRCEWYEVKHICLSRETAVKRFEEIRDKLIEDNDRMIEHDKEDDIDPRGWERENFLLRLLPPGGKCHCRCDHPDLVEWEVEE